MRHLIPADSPTVRTALTVATGFNPFEQNSRAVQAYGNARVLQERFGERQVRLLVSFLNDVVKIAHRLVRVED